MTAWASDVRVPMTPNVAETVWAILEEVCGATADHGFVHHQTNEYVDEWRFMGHLGFGGKFWRYQMAHRPDGDFGERWIVNCYREDVTPELRSIIGAANSRLWDVQVEWEATR